MILASLLAFLPALLIGLLVILLAWPGPYLREMPLKLALALGIGPGIVSCLYFAFCLFARPRSRIYLGLEALLLVGLGITVFLRRKSKALEISLPDTRIPPNGISTLLIAGLVIAAVLAAGSFGVQTLMQPHGIQDAWNIWNLRARFMFRGGPNWMDLFNPAIYWLNHPDYPFLVTAGSARAWYFLGNETTRAPAVQAALYSLGLAGILFAGLGSRRSWGSAALAALLLCASPWFVLFGAWQIADVPLDFFLCSALFLLVLVLSELAPARSGLLFLFGLAGGLAAWTKNEGLLFLAIVLPAWFAARLFARSPFRRILREGVPILVGLGLPMAVLAYFKFVIAPPNDLFVGQTSGSIWSSIADPSRIILTFQYMGTSLLRLGGWQFSLPILLLLFGLLMWKPTPIRIFLFSALTILALLAGYFVIFLITPHDLIWHLRTASDRLVFHIFPPALLILFWAVRTPEEIARDLFPQKQKTI